MRATILHLVVLGVLAAGCGATETPGPSPSEPTSPTAEPSTDDEAPTASPIVGQWASGGSPVDLGDGWELLDCEGDIPAQCIERDGTPAGLLELSDWPLTSELASASDATSVTAALQAFADDRHRETASDRAAGCGSDYEFASDETQPVRVGGLPGVRYGFTGTEAGMLTEHVVTYATVHADRLWLVVADAAASAGCMGSDELLVFEPDVLAELLPTIDRIVAGTPLPTS